jgi:hypothetical protein
VLTPIDATKVSAVAGNTSNGGIPQRILQRLDDLGVVLAQRGDALALLGLGSVGVDLGRLDDHSDLDFFVVVDDGAKQRYLDLIDWLEELHAVVFSFPNSVDGRKVLFADGLFAEYAIFTLDELRGASYPPGRIVWRRDDAPAGLESSGRVPGPSPYDNAEYQVNEALTNLYVGLHRELRGERLSAMRLIQVHAVDRLHTFLELTQPAVGSRQDVFVVERGSERRFGPEVLPLATLVPGYAHNREAALVMLEWLEARTEVSDVLATAIRQLLEREA